MSAVAFRSEDESARIVGQRQKDHAGRGLLFTGVFIELATLFEHLECLPERRGSGKGAVDGDSTMRESGADGLVDIKHYQDTSLQ